MLNLCFFLVFPFGIFKIGKGEEEKSDAWRCQVIFSAKTQVNAVGALLVVSALLFIKYRKESCMRLVQQGMHCHKFLGLT